MSRVCLLYACVLVVLALVHSPCVHAISCRPPALQLTPFCADYLNYNILATLNETIQDNLALDQSSISSFSTCPFFTYPGYTCRKYFQRCVVDDIGNNQTVDICRASCYAAKEFNHGECDNFDDSVFNQECMPFSALEPPLCDNAPTRDLDLGITWWKILLACIMSFFGLVILSSVLYRWYRSKRSAAEMDKEDDEFERKKREKDRKKQDEIFTRNVNVAPASVALNEIVPSARSGTPPQQHKHHAHHSDAAHNNINAANNATTVHVQPQDGWKYGHTVVELE